MALPYRKRAVGGNFYFAEQAFIPVVLLFHDQVAVVIEPVARVFGKMHRQREEQAFAVGSKREEGVRKPADRYRQIAEILDPCY